MMRTAARLARKANPMTDKQQQPTAPERIWLAPLSTKCNLWAVTSSDDKDAIPYARVHQTDDARVGARRVNITLSYIKRAAGKKLPELPCRVDEMTERELAIFKIGAEAVGTLQFIAREIEALETLGDLLPQLSSSEPQCDFCERTSAYFPAEIEGDTWIHRGRDNEAEFCTATPHPCSDCGGMKTSPECLNCVAIGIERIEREARQSVEEEAKLTGAAESSERRCGECGHGYSTFDKFLQRCNVIIDGASICGCKCVFPATGTTESEQQLTEVAAQAYVDGFDAAAAHATTAEGQDAPFANDPTWDSFQQSIREYSEQVNAAERGISTAASSTTTPDNTAREDLEALVQLLVEDVSEYFLDTDPKVDFTRLPNIIRMRLSRHLPSTAPVPAGVEGGAVAWLPPQIKRRLQAVLDCENGMCTHCCEVLAGDLAPMIDRAIELCATPAPAESGEAETVNGSEDSWMTL
jgi:hypothetical protein